jgi:hypothetical protein
MRTLVLLLSLLAARAIAQPMTFKSAHNGGNCAACEYIQATGEITPDTAQVFKAFLASQKFTPSIVRLDSPGGSLGGGIELGEIIRELKYSTEVGSSQYVAGDLQKVLLERAPGFCASACAYAFLGGATRTLDKDAKLGFHQFFDEKALSSPTARLFSGKDLDSSQRIMAAIVLYVIKMGADPRLVVVAAGASPTDMRWIQGEDARKLRVIYEPNSYKPWHVEPYKDGAIAVAESNDGLKTIMASCSKRFGPNVTLIDSDRTRNLTSWFEQCRNGTIDGTGHPVFGAFVPPDRVQISRRKDGASTMRFLLPNNSPPVSATSFL